MKKLTVRIIALIIALILIFGMFSGILPVLMRLGIPVAPLDFTAFADGSPGNNSGTNGSNGSSNGSSSGSSSETEPSISVWADARLSENVTRGKVDTNVSLTFNYSGNESDLPGTGEYASEDLSIRSGPFSTTPDTELRISYRSSDDYYQARLTSLVYTGGSGNTVVLEIDDEYIMTIEIPTGYFKAAAEDDAADPKPSIVIDTVTVKNSQGQVLTEIDKDTPAFTVEIVYADLGLADEPRSALERAKNFVFMTNSPGLRALNGTTGKIELGATSGDYPRYRVTFNNIKADGTGSAFNFFAQYELEDYDTPARSETVVAELPVDKDATESAILRPNVIISQYSYGDSPIIAGDVFDLEFRFENTSTATTVENMVATIEPADGFVITSASNTVFFPTMVPGENKPFTLSVQAREAVSDNNGVQTTQYSITVKFEYQYLDNKAYKDDTSEVKIAIPVTQLDRFAVDEITDYTSYMQAGEEGYLSVPITNKGKPTIGNISGFVEAITPGVEFVAPITRFGPLEGGGKSDTVDINITIMTPGEFSGNAVIEYEDGNMNTKRVSVPFIIMVEPPYEPPQMEMPGDMTGMEEQEPSGISAFSIVMCALGGALIAVPLALYMIKRLKLKGSEDFDEDF